MRVVAGSAKGVRLAPVPRGVRPVSDMAREGVFSSLGGFVLDAGVLDLYAGTGAMAIEALSRGAERAVLVERGAGAVRTIHENLARARVAASAEVVHAEAGSFLKDRDRHGGPFDLVIADPPYASPQDDVRAALAAIASGWLAHTTWRVVLTRLRSSSTPVIPVHWGLARRLTYGDTLVLIFREA